MTAATFVGFTSVKSQATTVVSTAPAGLQAGDHQLFIVTIGTGSETFSANPAGVTQIGAEQAQTTDTAKARIFYSTTLTGNVTFTKSSTRLFHVLRVVWRGGAGFDVASAQFAIRAAGASHALPTQTTTVADQKVIAVYWTDAGLNTVQTLTGPGSPWVERFNATESTTFPERSSIGVWEQDKNPPGAVNGNVSNSLGEDGMVFTIQLAEASAPATPVPVVDAGADASVVVGSPFTRTGTGSNSPTSWAWTIVSGPTGAGTTIGTAAALSWTPGTAGTYVLRLTATNAGGTSAPDDVTVTVTAAPTAPTASAGADVASHTVNTAFTRTATASDGGSAITGWAWTLVSGPAGGGTAGSSIGTAAALSWTPPVVGTYVLGVTATNSVGTSARDDVTVTVVASAPVTSVSIVQQGRGFATVNGATTDAIALPAAPASGALVLTGTSVNKNATSLSVAAPFTERAEYINTSVSGALADATGQQSASWTKGAQQSALGIFETNVTGATFRAAVVGNNTETGSTSVAADLGAAVAPGVVFAMVGVDSSWDTSLGLGGTWPNGLASVTWTNGYAGLAVIQTATAEGDVVGGAAFLLAYRIVATGDSTATTCSWAGTSNAADQAYMILSNYDTAPPTPAVSAGPDTTAAVNAAFSLTATEVSLTNVTARAWTVVSGPAQVGATLSTAAALNWTPTVSGVYVLRYSATHNGGAVVSDDVQVSVSTPTRSLTQAWLGFTSMTVKTSSSAGAEPVRIGFAPTSDMAGTVWSGSTVTPDANGISKHSIPALTPDSPYYYQVEVGGGMVASPQLFRTLPDAAGPRSFSFGFSSCRDHVDNFPDVNPTCLADMLTRGVDFFLEIGDFHYRDINTNDQPAFRAGYDELFTRSNIANVLKSVPSGYVWDDHDYGGDSSNGTTASRPAAQAVYRERVPHPTLPSATGLIYHTFRVGRVRFIMLDCRSARSPVGNADNSSKTMLGAEQKAWLQNLLNNADTPMTVIVSSVGWIGAAGVDSGQDHWAYYTTERAEVGGWITANAAKTKCIFLSGDAHMLAYDDGTNSVAGAPAYHAAALNQSTSTKGGPYSGGSRASNNAYGFMEVTDTGAQVALKYTGIYNGSTVWATHTTTVSAPSNNGRFLLGAF